MSTFLLSYFPTYVYTHIAQDKTVVFFDSISCFPIILLRYRIYLLTLQKPN